jgi:hypothetical protein
MIATAGNISKPNRPINKTWANSTYAYIKKFNGNLDHIGIILAYLKIYRITE